MGDDLFVSHRVLPWATKTPDKANDCVFQFDSEKSSVGLSVGRQASGQPTLMWLSWVSGVKFSEIDLINERHSFLLPQTPK